MKNHELFALQQSLNGLSGLRGVKFTYALNRNRDKIKRETERLAEAVKPEEDYADFEKAQRELFMKWAIKDENGEPKVFDEGGRPVNKIEKEDMPKYLDATVELKDKYKDAMDRRAEQMEEYNTLMGEDVTEDFEFYRVKLEYVPEDITDEQMAIIMPFIFEED